MSTTHGVCWLQGKKAVVFPTSCKPSPHPTGQGGGITEWQWGTSLHGECTRKLVNESRGIFMRLQDTVKGLDGNAKKAALLKASRSYRAVLQACIADISQTTQLDDEESDDQMTLLAAQQLLFALAELVFIQAPQAGYLVPALLDVVRLHFPPQQTTLDDVAEKGGKSQHFASLVLHYLAVGQVDEARDLLKLHELSYTSELAALDTLLARMPLFSRFSGRSCEEFDARWRLWQEEIRERLQVGEFQHDLARDIAEVLSGHESAILELRESGVIYHWLMLLGARMFWVTSPTAGISALARGAQDMLSHYGGMTQLTVLDSLLLAALELDLPCILKDSSEHLNSWWLPAHLTDLCQHAGILESQQLSFGGDLREFLLAEYAAGLISHKSLWRVAIDYFSQCPQTGRQLVRQCLERVPLDSEVKARKVIALCRTHQLPDLERTTCRVMCRRALGDGHVAVALNWAITAKDPALTSHIAERVLTGYQEEGTFSISGLVDTLGSQLLICPASAFLGQYRQFHARYRAGEFRDAATLLLQLLTSGVTPQRFRMTVLMDALPLLEAQKLVFDSSATYELMEVLEQVTRQRGEGEGERERLELLRQALARNLARAVLCDAGSFGL